MVSSFYSTYHHHNIHQPNTILVDASVSLLELIKKTLIFILIGVLFFGELLFKMNYQGLLQFLEVIILLNFIYSNCRSYTCILHDDFLEYKYNWQKNTKLVSIYDFKKIELKNDKYGYNLVLKKDRLFAIYFFSIDDEKIRPALRIWKRTIKKSKYQSIEINISSINRYGKFYIEK